MKTTAQLPSLSSNHRPFTPVTRSWWATYERSVRLHRFTLMSGDPGTGKTTAVLTHAVVRTGHSALVIQGTPQIDETAFWGTRVIAGGDSDFAAGPLHEAMRDGRHLVVEEITVIPPEVLATVLKVRGQDEVSNPFTNERIAVHPEFRFIATCNPQGLSCRRNTEIRQILLDDFHVLTVPGLTDAEARATLAVHFPEADDELLDWAIATWAEFREIGAGGKAGKAQIKLSVRAAYHLVQRALDGEDRHLATEIALVNKYVLDPDAHEAARLRLQIAS